MQMQATQLCIVVPQGLYLTQREAGYGMGVDRRRDRSFCAVGLDPASQIRDESAASPFKCQTSGNARSEGGGKGHIHRYPANSLKPSQYPPLPSYIPLTSERVSMNVLTDLADSTLRAAESAQRGVGSLFESRLRLGVTGLNRAGKTVFITSLLANLLQRGRMTLLEAEGQGRIEAAMLRPQPDPDVPRFEFEEHLAALSGPTPHWPESTRRISEVRLSLRFQRTGFFGGLSEALTGPGILHLDIVDYPGEWLLDLPLLNQSWAEWSTQTLESARLPERAVFSGPFLAWADTVPSTAPIDEMAAKEGARLFADYLAKARGAGLTAVSPGRFLMPGDLEGSPALTFAPIVGSGGLASLMAERYDAYKRIVIKPFFRDHFTKIDRQIVLVDALDAIDAGPRAIGDLKQALSDILSCFRHGENGWLAPLMGRKIDRLLFAATKADHIHHSQHERLEAILRALLRESVEKAAYSGAMVESMAIASLRATVEQTVKQDGEILDCVRGRDPKSGEDVVVFPGTLPDDPAEIVKAAHDRQAGWLSEDYHIMRFAPPILSGRDGHGPPHLRLDRAANFLIGDRLI